MNEVEKAAEAKGVPFVDEMKVNTSTANLFVQLHRMLFTDVQLDDFIDPLAWFLERLEIERESVEKCNWASSDFRWLSCSPACLVSSLSLLVLALSRLTSFTQRSRTFSGLSPALPLSCSHNPLVLSLNSFSHFQNALVFSLYSPLALPLTSPSFFFVVLIATTGNLWHFLGLNSSCVPRHHPWPLLKTESCILGLLSGKHLSRTLSLTYRLTYPLSSFLSSLHPPLVSFFVSQVPIYIRTRVSRQTRHGKELE